ncbi:MAG: sigma-70 family RNA polymerase sigma factor [Deltaproteobacteria bacterium]|nr:sigma-70 family RNA polymerase sigma factor [Deltaproteobacteria bacterium]
MEEGRSALKGSATRSCLPHDRALFAVALHRHKAAIEELIVRHYTALKRLARLFVSNEAAAEDVVQDSCEAALVGLRSFEGRSSLKTWMFRILVNQAKTRGQRDKRTVPFSSLGHEEDDDVPTVDPARFDARGRWSIPPQPWSLDESTPEKLLLGKEVRQLIEEAIASLPEVQGAVVWLRDVAGCSSDFACQVLDVSEANQRVLLHRGRSKLRNALEQYLGGLRTPSSKPGGGS